MPEAVRPGPAEEGVRADAAPRFGETCYEAGNLLQCLGSVWRV
jgi:hypothetical protein